MRKRKGLCIFFAVLSLLTLLFIFSNSLRDGEASSAQSNAMLEIVKPALENILPIFHIEPTQNNMSYFVRKAAHFFEFALLGFLCFLSIGNYPFPSRSALLLPFPICALCAAADETIQLFSSGRGAQISDSILDFAGSSTGILLSILFVLLSHHIFKTFNPFLKNKEDCQ